MAKPYIILVHGAYHQPTHWDLLVKLLQAAGHPTSTPKLPSSSASPLAGVFDADISSVKQAVIDAIAEGATSIVPVFHSYGGIPGFEALASLTPQQKLTISRVVCISAFILPKGDSVVSVQESSERTYVRVEVRKQISCSSTAVSQLTGVIRARRRLSPTLSRSFTTMSSLPLLRVLRLLYCHMRLRLSRRLHGTMAALSSRSLMLYAMTIERCLLKRSASSSRSAGRLRVARAAAMPWKL